MKYLSLAIIALIAIPAFFFVAACNTDDTVITIEEQRFRDSLIVVEYLTNEGLYPDHVTRTSSGLYYTETSQPALADTLPVVGDTVSIHYIGQVIYGDVFDRSRERGEPLEFTLGGGGIIDGVGEGTALMKVGERRVFYIPAYLAYGSQGTGTDIPANANLIFDIELVNAY